MPPTDFLFHRQDGQMKYAHLNRNRKVKDPKGLINLNCKILLCDITGHDVLQEHRRPFVYIKPELHPLKYQRLVRLKSNQYVK